MIWGVSGDSHVNPWSHTLGDLEQFHGQYPKYNWE
jgi:hypothetical protein